MNTKTLVKGLAVVAVTVAAFALWDFVVRDALFPKA